MYGKGKNKVKFNFIATFTFCFAPAMQGQKKDVNAEQQGRSSIDDSMVQSWECNYLQRHHHK